MPRQSTLKTIRQQIAKLEAQAKKLADGEEDKKRKAIAEVGALMRKLGVSLDDLATTPVRAARKAGAGPAKEKKKVSKPVPVKFRNGETGETWSGRGRTPRWLVAAEAAGRTRDEFKVE
jgi:DNA-binding protein H-NS